MIDSMNSARYNQYRPGVRPQLNEKKVLFM